MRRATGAQSGVIVDVPGHAGYAAALGQQLGPPHHHLRRDAAPVRALPAQQLGLDADHVEPGQGQAAGYLLASRAEPDDNDVAVHPVSRASFRDRPSS